MEAREINKCDWEIEQTTVVTGTVLSTNLKIDEDQIKNIQVEKRAKHKKDSPRQSMVL